MSNSGRGMKPINIGRVAWAVAIGSAILAISLAVVVLLTGCGTLVTHWVNEGQQPVREPQP